MATIVSVVLVLIYEYNVCVWTLSEQTAVIRADIVIIYPIIIGIAVFIYYSLVKILIKK